MPCSKVFPFVEEEIEKPISIFDKYIVSNKYDFVNTQMEKYQDYWVLKNNIKQILFIFCFVSY